MAKRIKKAETTEWEVPYNWEFFSSTGAVYFTEVFHYKFEVNQVPSLLARLQFFCTLKCTWTPRLITTQPQLACACVLMSG